MATSPPKFNEFSEFEEMLSCERLPRVSVVIPTHNEGPDLITTVAMAYSSNPPVHEIIVVDDQSDIIDVDEQLSSFTNNQAVEMGPPVKVVKTPHQKGAGGAKAHGMDQATGDIGVMLDAHMRLPYDWVTMVRFAFDRYPGAIFCACCRGFQSVAAPFIGCGCEFKRGQEDDIFLHRRWLDRGNVQTIDRCPSIFGACYIVPMPIWRKLGGFNPCFDGWGNEETDLSVRAWLAGYEVRRINALVVPHNFEREIGKMGDMMNSWHAHYNNMVMAATTFEDGMWENVWEHHMRQLYYDQAVQAFDAVVASGKIARTREVLQAQRQYTDMDLHRLCGLRLPTEHEVAMTADLLSEEWYRRGRMKKLEGGLNFVQVKEGPSVLEDDPVETANQAV